MEQGIKFVITGDTSGLDNASKKAASALDKLNSKITNLQKEIADNIRITQGYEQAIENLSKEFKDGIISQEKYAKSLERLQRDEKETTIETNRLRKELASLKRDQKELSSVGKNTFTPIKKGAANATPTLIEFSRVIQDAPYGIQGVANNIQQLTTNFGYLSKSAGGPKAAIKALLGSLAGPAGMVFAVSAVTSLLVSFGDELLSSGNKTKELEDKLENLNDTFGSQLSLNKEITRNLELQDKSIKENLGARKEILRNQLKSLDVLLKEQIEQLKIQQIQNQTTTDWEAFVLVLGDAFKHIKAFANVSLQLSKSFLKDALNTVEGIGDSWVTSIIPGIKEAGLAAEALNKRLEEKKKQNKTSKEDQQKETELQNKINELLTQQLGIRNEILETNKKQNKEGQKQVSTGLGLSFTPKIVSDPKEIAKATRSYVDKTTGEIKQITSDISATDLEIINPFKDLKLALPVVEDEAFTKSLKEAEKKGEIFSNALGSAFSALGNEIANVLQTGNSIVDAFVGSMVNSLTSLLAEFVANQIAMSILGKGQISGEQAKANASGIVIATQGATAFGPLAPAAFPGILAATLGTINAAFAPLYSFSQGGIVPGGSFTGDKVPILANGGEYVLTTQDQSLLTNFLRGGYASTTNTIGADKVQIEGVLRNETIYLANKRASKKNRRIN